MRAIEAIRRSPISIGADATVRAAAALMEQATVGSLVIVDDDGRPVGIVTDRDIVRRVVAPGRPLDGRIDSAMSSPVLTIDAGEDLRASLVRFREHAVRRLPIVEEGRFVGMVSIDDLLTNLTADLVDLTRPVTAETVFGHRDSPVPERLADA